MDIKHDISNNEMPMGAEENKMVLRFNALANVTILIYIFKAVGIGLIESKMDFSDIVLKDL